jgi:hypothetical protein
MAEALLAAKPRQHKAEAAGSYPAGARHEAIERRPAARSEARLRSLLETRAPAGPAPVQRAARPNRTGLPDGLKAGVEALSGHSMDEVRVHYHSPRPAQLQAHAYTQGSDIHVAPGQERHLAHEAWHVVQQKQGRVRPTATLGPGIPLNDDSSLEREADIWGSRAYGWQSPRGAVSIGPSRATPGGKSRDSVPVQRKLRVGGKTLKPNSKATATFLAKIKAETGSQADVDMIGTLIDSSLTYVADSFDAVLDHINDDEENPLSIEQNDDTAEMTDDLSQKFGATFKGRDIPFSGSRVYSVAHSEGQDKLWGMQNSATGYISTAKQDVVKSWVNPDQLIFPTNKVSNMTSVGLTRPTVMAANAHAEVNQIVQHAIQALSNKTSVHDLGLVIGSDIQHCAECWWAANAMSTKGKKVTFNQTGCGNKIFARWRQPYENFYKTYGPNPFRDDKGNFRAKFEEGEFEPHVLNAVMSKAIGDIYS